jgi:hypothetical protein
VGEKMNSFEMELLIKDNSQQLLIEAEELTKSKTSCPKASLIKKLIFSLSDAFIAVGLLLQNIYQPSIESTLVEYHALLLNEKAG